MGVRDPQHLKDALHGAELPRRRRGATSASRTATPANVAGSVGFTSKADWPLGESAQALLQSPRRCRRARFSLHLS